MWHKLVIIIVTSATTDLKERKEKMIMVNTLLLNTSPDRLLPLALFRCRSLVISGGETNLIDVMRLLMESDTVWECPASTDQVGGSLGLMASERAVRMRYDELSSMVLAETRIGSCAWEPWDQTAEGSRTGCIEWMVLFFTNSSPLPFGRRHRG